MATIEDEWTNDKMRNWITEFQGKPCLCETTNLDCHNKNQRKDAIEEIGQI